MAPNPQDFLVHLQTLGYNPRSNKHSNALGECIVSDLLAACPAIASKAASGELVYDLNFKILVGTADWNVDLVLGEPPPADRQAMPQGKMRRAAPSTVQIAIEHKTVMTEHRKAIRNRKRDFEAHHDHVHRYDNRAVAGAVLVVNGAQQFHSPLRRTTTTHNSPRSLVDFAVQQLRAVSGRNAGQGSGLDVRAAIVVDFDNINHSAASFITSAPAPQIGDPLHYDAFLQNICSQYTARYP